MKFRSPLLEAPPTNVKENRTEIMQKRVVIVCLLVVLLGLPTFALAMDWMPKDGPGHLLYWLHDHVYLTIKGWTYHRFQPAGTIWWTIGLVFFLTWLVFFLVDESMILSPHRDLTVFALRRPGLHPYLLRAAKRLALQRIPPRMLVEATDYERRIALDDLLQDPDDPDTAQRLGQLTLLQTRLLVLPGARVVDYLHAAVCWQESYLLLRRLFPNKPAWLAELAGVPLRLAPVLMPSPDAAQWRELLTRGAPRPLDGGDLMLDLLVLAALDDAQTAAALLDEALLLRTAGERRRVILKHLHLANAQRREALSRRRTLLEHMALGMRLHQEPQSPFGNIQLAMLPYLGRLTMDAALNLSMLAKRPQPAQAMVDVFETLSLTLSLIEPPEKEGDEDNPLISILDRYRAYTSRTPDARQYFRCAQLCDLAGRTRRKAWSASALSRDDVLEPVHFQQASARAQALRHAAGPGYEPAEEGVS